MSQSRIHSFIEAWANTFIGFVISLGLQQLVAIWYHYNTTFAENVQVVGIFTAASVLRTYVVRRYFNQLHTNKGKQNAEFQASLER